MADASGLDAGRLEQELSIVMSKADIREELTGCTRTSRRSAR